MVAGANPSIMRWFAPPRLATPDSTQRARDLWKISWSFFGLLAVLLLAASLATPSLAPRRLTSIVSVGALVTVLHLINRRGRTAWASWIFVLGLTVIVTQRAWQAGGVHSPVALFYVMFILLAAGLLGIHGTVVTAIACVVSAALLAAAEVGGMLTTPGWATTTPAEPFVAVVLTVAATVLALTMLLRHSDEVSTEDLVNMFVHDMRSPLTVVMGRLAMLRADLADDSETAEDADAAMAEAMRLSQMTANLLDFSRLASARLPLQRSPVDVSRLADHVAHALGALEPSRHIEVRAPRSVVCECDVELLRRIIENLVSNAIRHTQPDGHIVVAVSRAGQRVRLTVQDDGPGIPTGEHERVFERYSSKGMRTRSGHHSVGLGLAFCKLAVTAHGGGIRIENVTPHGSRFVVDLPGS